MVAQAWHTVAPLGVRAAVPAGLVGSLSHAEKVPSSQGTISD